MVKILAIDDKQDNLITLSALLKNIIPDCIMITAQSGAEGIEKARSELPDTILLDIKMPHMDGYEICSQLKADDNTKGIPIIMLTAIHIDMKSRIRGLELGADAFLTKPIDEAELTAQIKVMLRIKKAEDKLRQENDLLEEMVQLRTRQLSRSEERYRMIFNSANDALFVIQPHEECTNCKIMEVNDIACQMLGYSKEELLQLSPLDLIDPQNRVTFADTREKLCSKKHLLFEMEHIRKDGRRIPLEINTHLFDLQGQPSVLHIVRDITERKQAEKERQEMQAQLFQAQKMEAIGLLAGGVAHDFNNLLTTIQGNTGLMMTKVQKTDPQHERLQRILDATGRATNLTRQLLLFSRKQPMEFSSFNLNKTVINLLKMLNRLIGEDIKINVHSDPELWAIRASEGNIEQVIMNLVVNAKDAMSEGGTITIHTRNVNKEEFPFNDNHGVPSDKFVRLSISDTGMGMDEKIIKQIFEPFFTTKEAGKGTGLGLSVVYGIVKKHKGEIRVDTNPGCGSTFEIYLPAVTHLVVDKIEEISTIQEIRGNGERILLIEDEDEVRKFTGNALRDSGYIVFNAASAKEALDAFEREKGNFHLVFSDVVLPDLTGINLVDQLHSKKPGLLVLMTSGYTDQKAQISLIRERGFPFLPKPYALNHLLRITKKMLSKQYIL